jgi:hypothetical protein
MDIARALLAEIDVRLAYKIQTGESLEDVGSYFIMYTANATPPDYGTMSPLLIVSMGTVTAEETSIPPCMVDKQYPVKFSIFTEDNGDNEDSTAAGILDKIEDEFYGDMLSLSQWVKLTSKDYTQTSLPDFSGEWNGSGEITFTHFDTDMKEI